MIIKPISTPNGLASAHRVVKAEILDNELRLQVHMYPSAASAEQHQGLLWQEYPNAKLADLDINDPWGSIERYLSQSEGVWSGGTYIHDAAPVTDIENVRAIRWSHIKSERDTRESSGFDVLNLGRFDSDADSRNRIIGAVTAAKIAVDADRDYRLNWTLQDNSTVQLDADQVIAVGFALLTHIDAIHQHSRNLYARIQEAATTEEINAVMW